MLLLRHGETLWNTLGKRQGRGNSPLTARGKRQAAAYGDFIRQYFSDHQTIFVSPLGRTIETCNIVCSRLDTAPSRVVNLAQLMEIDHGDWQGLTKQQLRDQFPQEVQRRAQDRWNHQMPNGESFAMVQQRISGWLKTQNLEKAIVIAHAIVNRIIVAEYLALSKLQMFECQHPHGIIFRLDPQQQCAFLVSGAPKTTKNA